MADRKAKNSETRHNDMINNSSVSEDMTMNSEYLYVLGRRSSTITSDTIRSQYSGEEEGSSCIYFGATRKSVKSEDGITGITSTSERSDFISVSGDMTIKSEFPYASERESSSFSSDTTRSQHSGEEEGSSFISFGTTRESVKGSFTYESKDGSKYENIQFLKPEVITPLSDTPNCFNCDIDGQHVKATHFCRSCRIKGIYICYKCLQDHNRWHQDHYVDTLSVFDTSLSIKDDIDVKDTETHEDYKREKVSQVTLQHARPASFHSNVTIAHGAKDSHIEGNPRTTKHTQCSLEKKTSKGFNDAKRERFEAKSNVKQRFFQDKLYSDSINDMRIMKQANRPKLQKYGTYSVKSRSDTKCSIITSICQLGDGQLVLADSANSMIKILKADNYQLISSHNVEGHPGSLCLIERGKLAVECADNIIKIVLIEEEIQLQNSFEIKRGCTGLTYGKGNLYVCFSERIDVYSETGEKRNSFRPLMSSNTNKKFVHLHKITISNDKDTLYIAERESGIVVADTSGNVKHIIAQYIAEPDAICPDEPGFLFVTEVSSDRVLKINANDGSVIQELKEVSKNAHPISLCHDSNTNRLIVGVWSSNDIHVYTCT